MTIVKTNLPNHSILKNNETSYDYIDSYQGNFIDKNGAVTSTIIGKSFFMAGPKWVEKLFALRNNVVAMFGLKTSEKIADRNALINSFKCEKGEQIGLFRVYDKTKNEVLLGEDDKHLNFRVSLFIEQLPHDSTTKKLVISTTVKFHNWLGRLYFLPVRPFHTLIVPSILKGIIKNIEKE